MREGAISGFQGAWIVARREIRDQLRDWRILTPIILLTLFFPVLMNFTAQQAVDFVSRYGAALIGERLVPFLLMVVGFFPISISLVIALESFAGERERMSIEPLLATPLSDLQLYAGKLIASLATPLFAAYLGIFVYLLGLALRMQWYPSFQLLLQVLLLTTAQAVVMVTGAVVISSQTTSVRAANLLASFLIIPISQLIIGESMIMFWGRYSVLWWIVFGLFLIAGVLGRMGIRLFNREELLGREIDALNPRWAWGEFWIAFRGGARSPGEWFKSVITQSLPRAWVPMTMVAGTLAAAFAIGWSMAQRFTLPADLMDLDRLGSGLLKEMLRFGLMSGRGWAFILVNNLRALLLATLLGVFSFGVVSIIVLMTPLVIIGYFSGNMALAGHDVFRFLLALVIPHAVAEVPAMLIAGAAILQLGMAALGLSRGKTLSQGWLAALGEWARLSLGLVLPLLALAALLEVFITPRVALALLTGS